MELSMTRLMTPWRYEQCQSHGSMKKHYLPLLSPPSLAISNRPDCNFLIKEKKTWLIYANVPLLKHIITVFITDQLLASRDGER